MPFITQGKTNWKFFLIVIILAIIVGAGSLWYVMRQKVSPVWLPELKKQAEDNKAVAFIQDGDIWVSSKDLKNKYKVIDTKEDIVDFAFSSDGKEIYWLNGQEIWKRDSEGNIKMLVKAGQFDIEEFKKRWKDIGWVNQEDLGKLKGGIMGFELSPDGKYIAYQEIEDYSGCCAGPPTTPMAWTYIMKNDGTEKVRVEAPLEVGGRSIRFNRWFPDSKNILFNFSYPDESTQGSPFFEAGLDGKNPKIYFGIQYYLIGGKEILDSSAIVEWYGADPVFSPTEQKWLILAPMVEYGYQT